MNKTLLMDKFGYVLDDLMQSFGIEDDDMITAMLEQGFSVREINMMGLFDKKDVSMVAKSWREDDCEYDDDDDDGDRLTQLKELYDCEPGDLTPSELKELEEAGMLDD